MLRRFRFPLIGLLLATLPVAAGAATEIPAGTHVLLRMVNSVSTKTARDGDFVYLRTASPISVAGRILVPVNSYVQGVVTFSKRAGKVKGKAQLAIRLETLTLPGGGELEFAPLLSSLDNEGTGQRVDKDENLVRQGPDHGRDAKQIAILAGSGASIGGVAGQSWKGAGIGGGIGTGVGVATVLLGRGQDVQLRSGSSLDVVLDRPVSVSPAGASEAAIDRRPPMRTQ